MTYQDYIDKLIREQHECLAALSEFGPDVTLETDGNGLWFVRAVVGGIGSLVQASSPTKAVRSLIALRDEQWR